MTRKSYAKVNVFLKIVGRRDNYHLLASRFIRVKNLFDTISFEKGSFKSFTLEGDFGCALEQNTIFKAYKELYKIDKNIKELFKNYKVVVKKSIPYFAGLGGGSSNAAVFLIMVNDILNLGLSKDRLAMIGLSIGADVPFFVYEYDSANVSGIGEVVEKFDEDNLEVDIVTPNIECNTGKIFTIFRDKYYKEASKDDIDKLFSMKSCDILNSISIEDANDLYTSAVDCYPSLQEYAKPYWYFSGSGSSFFKIRGI